MSRQKLRVKNTQLDNLVSNLRGEVGEIISSWVLLRHIMASQRGLFSDDPGKDMANEGLAFVSMLREKLADEIVARLSELAEPKIGRLTFHFAGEKLEQVRAAALQSIGVKDEAGGVQSRSVGVVQAHREEERQPCDERRREGVIDVHAD